MPLRQTVILAIMLLVVSLGGLSAATSVIAGVDNGSGPSSLAFGVFPGNTLYTSWLTTAPFADVAITANLGPFTSVAPIAVFLTNQIGPGTTAVANQIAAADTTVTCASFPCAPTPLFTGLTLLPGPYFLLIESTGDVGYSWTSPSAPASVTLAPGVSLGGSGLVVGATAYPPARDPSSPLGAAALIFNVTGTEVPEPSPFLLCASGLLVLPLILLRTRR